MKPEKTVGERLGLHLDGEIALVTGGDGDIGAAIVDALAASGARVVSAGGSTAISSSRPSASYSWFRCATKDGDQPPPTPGQ